MRKQQSCHSNYNELFSVVFVYFCLFYKYIQPIIEYSAPVWSPFTKFQIDSIERIQHNFTRYALHYPAINYCEYLNILPLSFRREMIDIKLLFKSLYVSDFFDIVTSLLNDYKPDSRLWSSQNGPLFYPSLIKLLLF